MRYFLTILIVAMSIPAGAKQAAVVALDPAQSGSMLEAEQMEYLVTEKDLDWNEVRSKPADRWSTPKVNTVGTRAPDKAQWIRFQVINSAPHAGDFRLEIRWPLLQDIGIRILQDAAFGELYRDGRAHPASKAGLANKNVVVPFSLEGGEKAAIYLRIVDPAFLYAPTFVWSEQAYEQHSNKRLIVFSAALGVLLIMTLYNIFLYRFTRDNMYLVYSNSVFSTFLYVLAITDLGSLLWGATPWFVDNAYPVFSSYCFLSVTYFFRVFVDLKSHGGWVYKLNTLILSVWILVLLGNLTGFRELSMGITGPAGILGTLIGMISTAYICTKGSQAAKYFAVAWTPACIATIYSIFALVGIAPYFQSLEYTQSLAFVFEAVVLSIALADRINREREARESAQALALEQQASIVQLKERANAELEEQVDIRTRELRFVMKDLAEANTTLAKLSKTDSLTKLANRRHFDEVAENEIARAARKQQALSMALIDIDRFKPINDTHGHVAGDQCLRLVAKAVSGSVLRETDLVARYGGEEFAVVLPDTDTDKALIVAERIRKAIQEIDLSYEGRRIAITVSIGVAGMDTAAGWDVNQLVNAADKALYRAKQNGRNRVESDAADPVTPQEIESP